jgi:glyoxylase-like metal-dependent hydrolase (beta-lactamase superfamily II)
MPMTPGEVVTLSPLVRRVLAPNPSVFTGPGTNTYLIGTDDVAVIDPGPDDHEEHLDKVAEAGDGRIRWILVTHTHPDHSPGAAGLKRRTGARVMGYDERDGFVPDERIGDGGVVEAAAFRLQAIHTPGHASNHLCYRLDQERLVFSGDHIMSGSTVVIHPPDGDMAAYLGSLARLQECEMEAIAPGHGEWIDDPHGKVDEYVAHRMARERAVEAALRHVGKAKIKDLVEAIYVDVPAELHRIARYSVWAHLRKLEAEGQVRAPRRPNKLRGVWRPVPDDLPDRPRSDDS